jgi:hypothetical protein
MNHVAGRTPRWRRVVPIAVSVVLVVWVVLRASSLELARAASQLQWQSIVPLTAFVVVALYLWDTWCVRWLFTDPGAPVSYRIAAEARGTAYLAGVFSYGIGQGVLAWRMARARGVSLVSALSRFVLLAYHDVAVLLSVGLLGAWISMDSRLRSTEIFCAVGLAIVAGLAVSVRIMPVNWRRRAVLTRWGAWLGTWSWSRSVRLCGLRAVNFAISMLYAVVALSICGVRADPKTLCSAIPLIQLSEGLPITVSGLGTREATLLYVLNPDRPERVLAFGLIWSSGLIVGRLAIGLGTLWLSRGSLDQLPADPVGLANNAASAKIRATDRI